MYVCVCVCVCVCVRVCIFEYVCVCVCACVQAVQPAAGAHMIPKVCRYLMTSELSPITDFYPKDFKTDPNDMRYKWLWIALLPFIDEKRLNEAIELVEPKFTASFRFFAALLGWKERGNQHS